MSNDLRETALLIAREITTTGREIPFDELPATLELLTSARDSIAAEVAAIDAANGVG